MHTATHCFAPHGLPVEKGYHISGKKQPRRRKYIADIETTFISDSNATTLKKLQICNKQILGRHYRSLKPCLKSTLFNHPY
jgi:hypothetical protein